MSPGADQYRLAVAVFDDPQGLWRAVRALMSDGVLLEQLCLAAVDTTMARLDHPARGGGDGHLASALLSQVQDWPGEIGRPSIVATSGPLLDALRQVRDGWPDASADGHAVSHHRPELADHVLVNNVTLVVRSHTPAQQSQTTRTLLSHSSHRVKTFEFTFAQNHPRSIGQ